LAFDGLTGGIQDKIRDKHQVQAYHMMYSMNIWSCLWASIGIIATGEIYGLYNFLKLYPNVIYDMFLLGLTGAIGQVRQEFFVLQEKKTDFCFVFFRILSSLLLNGLAH
jgi:hypothetical protein